MRNINGANILLLLREGIANDWPSLCREFGARIRPGDTLTMILSDYLLHLRELDLVEFGVDPNRPNEIRGPITVTDQWTKIHKTLGGQKLAELAELGQGSNAVVVKPIFGRPQVRAQAGATDLFVVMPFREELGPIYEDHIKSVASSLELSVKRADDLFTAHAVTSDIWEEIWGARAIVADCTGRNPNVFYEIGLAHAVGKAVILITQDRGDVPFDIAHIRYIQYEYTPRGIRDFEQKLTRSLQVTLSVE